MEAFGPGEEALRAGAAAAVAPSREGNPEKLRGVQGTKPPPVSTSSSNTFPSLPSFLKLPNVDYICNFSMNTTSQEVPDEVSHLSNPLMSSPSRGLPFLCCSLIRLVGFCTPGGFRPLLPRPSSVSIHTFSPPLLLL